MSTNSTYPRSSESKQAFLDDSNEPKRAKATSKYLIPTCASSSRMSTANETESQIALRRKVCGFDARDKKKSTPQVDLKKSKTKQTDSGLRVTVSQKLKQQSNIAKNVCTDNGNNNNCGGSSFLARICVLDSDPSSCPTPDAVENFLNANPDFMSSYICKNIPHSVIQAWASQKCPAGAGPTGFGNMRGGGGCGMSLQATAPYHGDDQGCGGMPIWSSGIPSQKCKRKVKNKCALSTLINYYRQGQEVIDWSGGMSQQGGTTASFLKGLQQQEQQHLRAPNGLDVVVATMTSQRTGGAMPGTGAPSPADVTSSTDVFITRNPQR